MFARALPFTLCVSLLLICSTPLSAVYLLRYATVAKNGAITFTGNTLGLSKQINANEPGTSDAIGAFITTDETKQVGNYPIGTTLDWHQNRSTAVLDIPANSFIEHAELIWGGSYGYFNEWGEQGEDPNIILTPANDPITLITPDQTPHLVAPIEATKQNVQNPTVRYSAGNYVRSADVTEIVKAAGGGTYTVGGIPATLSPLDNTHNAAGWTLAVVYSNPTMRTRNMSLFVGCEQASYTTNQPAIVEGFCTPPDDDSQGGRLFVSALEADAIKVGDKMLFGQTATTLLPLSGVNNPQNNFFCSQINSKDGLLDTRGSFGDLNAQPFSPAYDVNPGRQGYDITCVDLSSTLTSNQHVAYALGTTQGDDYTINALGIEIDVDAPFIETVKKVNGQDGIQAEVGDIVEFTITVQNNGSSIAYETVFKDPLEEGLSYVPDTLTLNGVALETPNLSKGIALGDLINQGEPVAIAFQAKIERYPTSGNIYHNASSDDYLFTPCQCSDPIPLKALSNVVTIELPHCPPPTPPTPPIPPTPPPAPPIPPTPPPAPPIPPAPPVTPANPPKFFKGICRKCVTLDLTTYSIEAWWKKIKSPDLIQYRIYANGKKIAEFSPDESSSFKRCLPNKHAASHFEIAAVYRGNIESEHLPIRVKYE